MSEERRLLELVLREPVTPLQALKKTTVEKGREEEEKGEGIEEGEGRKEGWAGRRGRKTTTLRTRPS